MELLLNSKDNSLLTTTIKNLSNLSLYLRNYYNEDELYNRLNRSENNITKTNTIGFSNGEKVIESAMVFTNFVVAKHFKENNLPFIYRNHVIDERMIKELNDIKKNIIKIENSKDYLKYIESVKMIYPKAIYELECKGHFGLGIDYYAHVTSPLRRFSDVIASMCLDSFYFENNDNQDELKNKIMVYSNKINNKRSSIEKFSIKHDEK